MSRSMLTPVWRSGSHSLSFALGIVMLCGGAQAGQPESLAEGRRSLLRAAPGTLLDLNALFAEDDSCPMTKPRRSSYESVGASAVVRSEATPHDLSLRHRTTSGIRLVALETLYENSLADSSSSAEAPPTFAVPQQPMFHEAGGDAFSGPSATQGTWVLVAP